MEEWIEKSIREQMLKDVDGTAFYIRRNRDRRTDTLRKEVLDSISKCGLSVSEAKGFLDYMKLVIDSVAYLPQGK